MIFQNISSASLTEFSQGSLIPFTSKWVFILLMNKLFDRVDTVTDDICWDTMQDPYNLIPMTRKRYSFPVALSVLALTYPSNDLAFTLDPELLHDAGVGPALFHP